MPVPQYIVKLNRFWYYDSRNGKRIKAKNLKNYVEALNQKNNPVKPHWMDKYDNYK